ncbi:MAG: hypothetical protein AB7T06_10905 [Kofleriaceae bacterium]
MKKKKHHRSSGKRPSYRPRNAASGATTVSRPRPRIVRGAAPQWQSIVAAVAGGAGSAALGGLVVNQQILSAETVGIGLMLGGGATAYFSEGIPRIVGTSVAASGAGQFALAIMNKRALRAHEEANKGRSVVTNATTAPQLAPPPAVARQDAHGDGVVGDMFRDAANDLSALEDEWRYGIRDDAQHSNEPIVIDLDEAA